MTQLFQIQDEVLRWDFIKQSLPISAKNLLQEYKRNNGFLPYEQGYVYLIHAVGTDYYKIGKTINPDRRILQIAPKMPFPVRYKKVWASNFMSYAEKFLHRTFDDYRSNGEWFSFPESRFNIDYFSHRTTYDTIRNAYSNHFFSLFNEAELSKNMDFSSYVSVVFDPIRYSGSTTIGTIERLFSDISFDFGGVHHEMV